MYLPNSTIQKYNELMDIFSEMESVLVAYSGGVDSSLLLKIGTETLQDKCIGAIGISPSLAREEHETALNQAKIIGANLIEIQTHETKNSLYIVNSQNRCYFCKSELFDALKDLARKSKILLSMNLISLVLTEYYLIMKDINRAN